MFMLTILVPVLWDVRPQELTGSKLEKLFELAGYVLARPACPAWLAYP